MPGCRSCGRPVAVARPTCVYCGAPVDAAAPALPVVEPTRPDAPARLLVVLETAGADPAALGRLALLQHYDAERIVRRGGLQLLGVHEPDTARRLEARLAAAGLRPLLVAESDARREPLRVLRGERTSGGLALRTAAGELVLTGPELLLVVTGPIARVRGSGLVHRKVASARPDEGWCAHLHRRTDQAPLELDPARIELGFTVTGSARLELASWVAELARHAPHDEGFRRETPAFGPAETQDEPLLVSLVRPPASGAGPTQDAARVLFDNLAQFRFYSGWRAAVERQRAGSRAPGEAC